MILLYCNCVIYFNIKFQFISLDNLPEIEREAIIAERAEKVTKFLII